jgi:hypothetical protein
VATQKASAIDLPPLDAYRIEDLVERGPFGRTTLFNAIKTGQLRARKYGRCTVILSDEWSRFLAALPDARAA